jgi:hypothetical protein
MKTSGKSCREKVKVCLVSTSSTVMPREGGHPVRRGVSAQALLSLEYWIARSSLVKPGDDGCLMSMERQFYPRHPGQACTASADP